MHKTSHTKRLIFTGTPGSGKTAVLNALSEIGYCTVPEAATDVIAIEQASQIERPWEHESFIDKIAGMQKQRQLETKSQLQLFDRSPFCTYALALYLSYPISKVLSDEIERCLKDNIYDKRVFFFENLGFIEHTEARKISYEEAIKFERIHIDVYKKFGFKIVIVPKAPIKDRCDFILKILE